MRRPTSKPFQASSAIGSSAATTWKTGSPSGCGSSAIASPNPSARPKIARCPPALARARRRGKTCLHQPRRGTLRAAVHVHLRPARPTLRKPPTPRPRQHRHRYALEHAHDSPSATPARMSAAGCSSHLQQAPTTRLRRIVALRQTAAGLGGAGVQGIHPLPR